TNPHSQLHILSQPEVIPNNSGGKENWYIKFITHYMSNLNIPGVTSDNMITEVTPEVEQIKVVTNGEIEAF
ncbi:hypothetical protein MKC72_18955, partial [[Clostridium] innocuum]|nr:hypothetical protein [[Clostridium] innocuum]